MVPRDWLHVPIGVLFFALVAAVLMRLRHGPSLAWAATLALAFVNEAFDAAYAGSMDVAEASKDVLATMALPTILLILLQARARKRLPTRPQGLPADGVQQSEAD